MFPYITILWIYADRGVPDEIKITKINKMMKVHYVSPCMTIKDGGYCHEQLRSPNSLFLKILWIILTGIPDEIKVIGISKQTNQD